MHTDTTITGWTGTRVHVHVRGMRWYAIALALIGGGIAYGILSGSWLFSIVCVLAAFVHYRVHARDDVTTHRLSVADGGIAYDGRFVRSQDVLGFWLITGRHELDIRLPLRPDGKRELRLIVTGGDAEKVRTALAPLLPELHDRKENVFDMISRICKI